ncbi:MAG: efflux RND transporter permease subunit [Myxococcales bacterium]|nr:efflux RND transporter permease subunit [Myxococcales bacterium]
MIAAIVRASIAHRGLVLLATFALAIAAVVIGLQLKLDALPDITNNQVLVLTRAPGLTPEEVERQVTRPIEIALGGLPDLVDHRSITRYGISSVTAIFADEVDPYRARQLVAERLALVSGEMPPGVDPPELGPVTGGLGEVFHFTLASPGRTQAELLELAQWRVAPLLRGVEGVVEVNTWGGETRTLEVVADPLALAQRRLTLDDLRVSLERATGAVAGATLAAGSGQALLRGIARPTSPEELKVAIAASFAGDEAVRVADVAEVRFGARPRIGAATADGRGEVVYVMVQMLRDENALDLMGRLHARMPEVRQALPADVTLDVVYDRSNLVYGTLRTVAKNLAEGGLLVVIVLFALLGSLRAGLLVAAAIPLSMLGATVGMVGFGIAGNLMSLGAIDFGLVVDGSVVMIEHIFHAWAGARERGEAPTTPEARREWIARTCEEVARPVFFSVLIILLVYVPVISLTGVDGKMFRPMALTVVFALVTALILALTTVPALASLLLRERDVPRRAPLLARAIDRAYAPLLGISVGHPLVVTAIAGALLVGGGALYLQAGSELVPQLDEGDLVIQTTRSPDISIESGIREAGALEAAARAAAPEVTQVVSRIGSPAIATDIMGLEQADVFVGLKPRDAWPEGLSREALIERLEEAINAASPGSNPAFTQPIQMRFNELLAGAVADVTINVYGEDLGELRRLAEAILAAVDPIEGAADARILAPPDVSLLEVRPRPLAAAQVGLAVGEVLDAVQAVRTGVEVGTTYDGPVRIPILLRLANQTDAFTFAGLGIPTPAGALVPLDQVAEVELGPTPGLVNHHRGERRLIVGFNVRGADLGALVQRAEAAVAAKVELPRGYRIAWGGQYEVFEEAVARLKIVIPAVIVLILGTLMAAFRRLRPTLIIFTNVPFACVGGIVALAIRGMPVSISAAVGFIALSGVAVLNGVVLLSRVLANEEGGLAPREAAREAARTRARPVLMTALVAALGFVPMMVNTGIGAEVQRPLATVVVGGLVTSTLLTLLILPSLYPWLAGRRRAPGS